MEAGEDPCQSVALPLRGPLFGVSSLSLSFLTTLKVYCYKFLTSKVRHFSGQKLPPANLQILIFPHTLYLEAGNT